MDALCAQLAAARASASDAARKVAALESANAELEDASRALQESLETLRMKAEATESSKGRLEREVAALRARQASSDSAAEELKQRQVEESDARILQLEARVATACKDLRVAQNRLKDAEKAAAVAREEDAARASQLQQCTQQLAEANADRAAAAQQVWRRCACDRLGACVRVCVGVFAHVIVLCCACERCGAAGQGSCGAGGAAVSLGHCHARCSQVRSVHRVLNVAASHHITSRHVVACSCCIASHDIMCAVYHAEPRRWSKRSLRWRRR
jgi:hypothetical protein